MTDEQTAKDQAREALYTEILANVKDLSDARGHTTTASTLRTLAEAYAWVAYPNQPH
ncbi:hypothetical protein ACFVDT_07080 [Streptomyces sp. NPDC057699]|uniref:hypothetical protein n=1 Tax=Streptomyces sp. NPDC057699 TaxID=3346220 RepID=UPI0036900713